MELEELSARKQKQWLYAINYAFIYADYDWIIDADGGQPPQVDDQQNKNLVAVVRSVIRRSIPQQVREELPID